DGVLDGEERGGIEVEVVNRGSGEAHQLAPVATFVGAPPKGLIMGKVEAIPKLSPGGSAKITIPLEGSLDLSDGEARVRLEVREGNGFDLSPPMEVAFKTRAFIPPLFVIRGVSIVEDATGNGVIDPGEQVKIEVRLANEGGRARQVTARAVFGENIFPVGALPSFNLGDMEPGSYRDLAVEFFTNRRATSVPLKLSVSEARKRFDRELPLNLELNRTPEKPIEVVVSPVRSSPSISPVEEIGVDVEIGLPRAVKENRDGVGVVIGNSNYRKVNKDVPDVEFALRDAEWVRRYLVQVLGYREGTILYISDASFAQLQEVFGTRGDPRGRVSDLIKRDQSDLFVYYSGHGAPSVEDKRGYLVPIDCHPRAVKMNGYSLDVLFENLGQVGARSVTIVIDACFSGLSGGGEMIIGEASPVGLVITDPTVRWRDGVLYTAGRGDQLASWYRDKRHGLFTYFFLKGLKGEADLDRDGVIRAGELALYLSDYTEGVPYWARRLHSRDQIPEFRGDSLRVIRGQVK
ncbi:MAG: caspase family protein, partial [bacterium]